MDIRNSKIKNTNLKTHNYQDTSVNQNQKNNTKSIFDRYFNNKTKKVVDANKDNHISIDEVKQYVLNNKSIFRQSTIIKIASFLGIEKNFIGDINEDSSFINEILYNLDLLKKVDKKQDSIITFEEITNNNEAYNSLNKSDKIKINRIFGIVDYEINNKQGEYGDCYLLTGLTGVAKSSPETFKKIIQQDSNGDITVTFWGAFEKPFKTVISNKKIQYIQSKRAEKINNESDQKYGSIDTEAIAIELAYQEYQEELIQKKSDYQKNLQLYIDNSTIHLPQKPDVENWDFKNLTKEQKEDILDYLRNSKDTKTGKTAIIIDNINFENLSDRNLEELKNYIRQSEATLPKKPTATSSWEKIQSWLRNSTPNSDEIKKPKPLKFPEIRDINDGGRTEQAIQLLTNGSYERFNKNKKNDEYVKKLLDNFDKINHKNKIYSVSFNNDTKKVLKNHAYLIETVTDNKVVLVNPHDSTDKIYYSKRNFLKNYNHIAMSTIQ